MFFLDMKFHHFETRNDDENASSMVLKWYRCTNNVPLMVPSSSFHLLKKLKIERNDKV